MKMLGLEAPAWAHQILLDVEPDCIRNSLGSRALSHPAVSFNFGLSCHEPTVTPWHQTTAVLSHFFSPLHTSGDWVTRPTSLDVLRFCQNLNSSFGKVRCHRICKSHERFVSPACCRVMCGREGACLERLWFLGESQLPLLPSHLKKAPWNENK